MVPQYVVTYYEIMLKRGGLTILARGPSFYTSESDVCRLKISARTVFIRQNLMSVDDGSAGGQSLYVRIWRL